MRTESKTLVDALPIDERFAFLRADTKRAVYVALDGRRAPSFPALREAERRGYLSDAIHLRRLKTDAVCVIVSGY